MLDDDHFFDYPLLPKCGPSSELIGHLETPQVRHLIAPDYPLLPKCGPSSELIGHLETAQVRHLIAPDCA